MRKGFTLIELMVTLAVAAIILVFASNSVYQLYKKNQVTTDVNRIVAQLNFARTAAVNKGVPVTICPSPDGKNCSTNWASGMLVFIDTHRDRQFTHVEKILHYFPKFAAGVQVDFKSFQGDQALTFLPTGYGRAMAGSFTYRACDNKAQCQRKVILNRIGRVRIAEVV